MRKALVILLLVALSVLPVQLSAESSSVRFSDVVKTDDWAKFAVKTFFFANVSEDKLVDVFGKQFINGYKNMNGTTWLLIVNETSDKGNIIFTVRQNYRNDSSRSTVFRGNVYSGVKTLNLWFVSPNLNEGDPLYIDYNETELRSRGYTVLGITTLTFANASRECVFSDFIKPEAENVWARYTCYWDRTTGVLCRMITGARYPGTGVDFRANIEVELTETSLWSSSGDYRISPYIVLMPIIFGITILLVIVFMNQKNRRVKRRRVRYSMSR